MRMNEFSGWGFVVSIGCLEGMEGMEGTWDLLANRNSYLFPTEALRFEESGVWATQVAVSSWGPSRYYNTQ